MGFKAFSCLFAAAARSDGLGSLDWLDTPVLSVESYSKVRYLRYLLEVEYKVQSNERNLLSVQLCGTVI